MEAERAAAFGTHADLGRAAQVPVGLQNHLRRRREHEPLRDHDAGRLGRAHERGGGAGVDGARHAHLSACGVAEPGAARALGLHAIDPHDAAAFLGPHVSAHARGARRSDAGVGALMLTSRAKSEVAAMR